MNEKTTVSAAKNQAVAEETHYQINPSELLTDIRLAIGDVFEATVQERGNALVFNFTNGQEFRLALGEVVSPQGR